MVYRTVRQHESSNSLVAMVAHWPLGARLRSECRPTMASAPPRPSGASTLTGCFAISCVRPSPVTANRPSPHVATSIVGFVTDYLSSPSCRGLSELLNKAMRSLQERAIVAGQSARPINDFPAKSHSVDETGAGRTEGSLQECFLERSNRITEVRAPRAAWRWPAY